MLPGKLESRRWFNLMNQTKGESSPRALNAIATAAPSSLPGEKVPATAPLVTYLRMMFALGFWRCNKSVHLAVRVKVRSRDLPLIVNAVVRSRHRFGEVKRDRPLRLSFDQEAVGTLRIVEFPAPRTDDVLLPVDFEGKGYSRCCHLVRPLHRGSRTGSTRRPPSGGRGSYRCHQ